MDPSRSSGRDTRSVVPVDVYHLIEEHGILLEAAIGPISSVAELVAGEQISGSWWSHPAGNDIFLATRALRDSPDVLVCRLVNGKVTFIHRRLWPAIVTLAKDLGEAHLAQLHEEHSTGGRHVVHEIPFPDWVPSDIARRGKTMTEQEALAQLPPQLRPTRPND